jgi:hypothetical protein
MTILQYILKILQTNNGKFEGTGALCNMVPASTNGVHRTLTIARHKRLVTSIRTHGGRGHRSIHRITRKGVEYANRI